jgi:hypothetical protein
MPITIKFIGYTPYIAVASPSALTDQEWVDRGRRRGDLPGPVYSDYALMKVLYMLRSEDKTIRVNAFKWEDPLVPLDFSGLRDTDILYIVGHGDPGGLYALGPETDANTKRLVKILTKDGNLKKKRKGKDIIIGLLSCRAGLGLHKVLARRLYNELGGDVEVIVAGAKGFTFGSLRTSTDKQNEVLIEGIPWYMEYDRSITKEEAEKKTSAREGKTITYASKEKEIDEFKGQSQNLEKEMKDLIKKLKSKEVNNTLDEIQDSSDRDWWITLIWQQQQLYANAKIKSNLEFDMWYSDLTEAYVFANGKGITDADVTSILTQVKVLSSTGLTSIK